MRKLCDSQLAKIGLIILNLGIFCAAFTRSLAYSGVLGAVRESPGPKILSDDGELLWFYGLLWGLCAVLALIDLFRLKIGSGLMVFIPLMGWWGFSYLLAWAASGYHSWDWMSLGIYAGATLIICGFTAHVVALRSQNKKLAETRMTTGVIEEV